LKKNLKTWLRNLSTLSSLLLKMNSRVHLFLNDLLAITQPQVPTQIA
jgi:hypothetical protein